MTHDKFIEELKLWRRKFEDDVLSHFRNGDDHRGNLAFDGWKIRLVTFLKLHIPSQANKLIDEINSRGLAYAIGGGSGRGTSLEKFLEKYGDLCLAFIDNLIDETLKGYTVISGPQKDVAESAVSKKRPKSNNPKKLVIEQKNDQPQVQAYPDLVDTLIIILVSAAAIIFIFWIASQTLNLSNFVKLPDFIQDSFSAVWTSIASGVTGIGLAVYKALTRKPNQRHPSYLLWIGIVTVSFLLLILVMLLVLKNVTPISNSNYGTNIDAASSNKEIKSVNQAAGNSNLSEAINANIVPGSNKLLPRTKKSPLADRSRKAPPSAEGERKVPDVPAFRPCEERGDCNSN